LCDFGWTHKHLCFLPESNITQKNKKSNGKEYIMSNLCMGGGGQFVDRSAVAEIVTPHGTASWKPVPHIEVIDAVTDVGGDHEMENY
jgi:hypothetical protein